MSVDILDDVVPCLKVGCEWFVSDPSSEHPRPGEGLQLSSWSSRPYGVLDTSAAPMASGIKGLMSVLGVM